MAETHRFCSSLVEKRCRAATLPGVCLAVLIEEGEWVIPEETDRVGCHLEDSQHVEATVGAVSPLSRRPGVARQRRQARNLQIFNDRYGLGDPRPEILRVDLENIDIKHKW